LFWTGLALCEGPGVINGSYDDGKQTIPLKGVCKIEPQRELSVLGHNMLIIDFILPPKGMGLSIHLESHYFRKKITAGFQLAPKPGIQLNLRRIAPSEIN
jgi:hypothetical protein